MSESILLQTGKNDIYIWGWNEHGNLSLGDKLDSHSPV